MATEATDINMALHLQEISTAKRTNLEPLVLLLLLSFKRVQFIQNTVKPFFFFLDCHLSIQISLLWFDWLHLMSPQYNGTQCNLVCRWIKIKNTASCCEQCYWELCRKKHFQGTSAPQTICQWALLYWCVGRHFFLRHLQTLTNHTEI